MEEAREILRAASAVNVDARRAEWRQAGWSSFGETAERRPKTKPENLATQPDRPRSDPLLDLEVDRGGT